MTVEFHFDLPGKIRSLHSEGAIFSKIKTNKNMIVALDARIGKSDIITHTSAGAWGYYPGIIDSSLTNEEECYLYCETVRAYIQDMGINICATPQGISSKLLRSALTQQQIPGIADIHTWRSLRRAYRGGYSSVVRTWFDGPVAKIDRNSAYPAIMRDPLPSAFVRDMSGSIDIRPDGIYRCTVDSPDQILPILPSKTQSGSVAYPIGRRTDTWTGEEILYAESRGYQIQTIHAGWIPTMAVDLSGPVETLLEARKRIPKPYNSWCKIAANSIAGMVGKRDKIKIFSIGEIPTGWKASALDIVHGIDIGEREIMSISASSQPGTAAFITARARLHLLDVAQTIGDENILYADTDSLAFPADHLHKVEHIIGGEYGQWKMEKMAGSYYCVSLRKIRWDRKREPIHGNGEFICGRLLAGTFSVPATINALSSAERLTTDGQKEKIEAIPGCTN